jgi:hypothetical protein
MNKTISINKLKAIKARLNYQKTIIKLLSITLIFMSITILLQSINTYKTTDTSNLLSNTPIPANELAEYMEAIQD